MPLFPAFTFRRTVRVYCLRRLSPLISAQHAEINILDEGENLQFQGQKSYLTANLWASGNNSGFPGVRIDMDFERIRAALAAPFACLFLILLLCAMDVRRPPAMGHRIPFVHIHHDPQQGTCDGRFEFARLTADGMTWINEEEIPRTQIGSKIAEIMENRAERVVYVEVDSNLPYGEFASFLDQIVGSTADMHVVVISGEVRKRFEKSGEDFSRAFDKGQFPLTDPLDVCDLE